MKAATLVKRISAALDDLKAHDIRILDVSRLTSIADYMIIASGRSDRQVRALADRVVETARKLKVPVLGTEGEDGGEWVVVDLGDVLVHVMHPSARLYYQLEKLWSGNDRKTLVRP